MKDQMTRVMSAHAGMGMAIRAFRDEVNELVKTGERMAADHAAIVSAMAEKQADKEAEEPEKEKLSDRPIKLPKAISPLPSAQDVRRLFGKDGETPANQEPDEKQSA